MVGKFAIGDLVTFVNDYGAKFPEKTVISNDHSEEPEPRYFVAPTDASWLSVKESQLTHDADDMVVAIESGHKIRYAEVDGCQWFLVGVTKQLFKTMERAVWYARSHPHL